VLKVIAVSAAVLLLAATTASAQPASPPVRDYHVLGVGTITCADWTKEAKQALIKSQNQAWLLGYLTAFNRFGTDVTGDVMGKTSNREALEWFDNYCVEHATDSVNWAAGALILELERRDAADRPPPPPPEPAKPPEPPMFVPVAPAIDTPAPKPPAKRPAPKKK
jgi:hypothetical protein